VQQAVAQLDTLAQTKVQLLLEFNESALLAMIKF